MVLVPAAESLPATKYVLAPSTIIVPLYVLAALNAQTLPVMLTLSDDAVPLLITPLSALAVKTVLKAMTPGLMPLRFNVATPVTLLKLIAPPVDGSVVSPKFNSDWLIDELLVNE